jgi:hypothetical protein
MQILTNETNSRKRKSDNATITEFLPGTYVLAEYPDSGMGPRAPDKLFTPRQGPFLVLEKERDGRSYLLRDLATQKIKSVNIHRLREYLVDEFQTSPEEVANREHDFLPIRCISAHKGNIKKVSSLQFFVEWNDPTEDNSWEPWSGVRTTEALHTYLRAKNLSRLIPKRFKSEKP